MSVFNDTSADHKWSTVANWSPAKPTSSDDVTINPAVTSLIIDETATCLSFDATGTAGITISGTETLSVAGNFTLASNVTWTHTGAVNITTTSYIYTAGRDISSSSLVTITVPDSSLSILWNSGTFSNLTIVFNPVNASSVLQIRDNQTIEGTLTLTANITNGNIRAQIVGNELGGQHTLTAATVSMTGAIDFRDMIGAGAASWDLSASVSGNLGGNSNITFRTPANYYLVCGTNDYQDYNNVWSVADDGTADGASVFPLPQDTIIINNNSWSDSGGHTFLFHEGTAMGNVDASGLTKSATICLPRLAYGSIDYTGSGVTVATPFSTKIDARLKNESSATLDINVPSIGASTVTVTSYGGTVKLLSSLTTTGAFTLWSGTLNLNGQTLTAGTADLSTYNWNTRAIQDGAGNGKIILTGVTGTIWDCSNVSNLTISNAPKIDIGNSAKTLTGDVTFIGGGKTYGDFTIKKHAGNFDCIITGSNTFGTITLETPDASYPYSDLQITSGTTQTATGLVCDGTASYQIDLKGTADHAVLHIDSGSYTVTYTDIENLQAEGGATFLYGTGSTVTGDTTGWASAGFSAWGEETPNAGEQGKSWQDWEVSAGVKATIIGDPDWGDLCLSVPVFSPVVDQEDTSQRVLDLETNVYGTGYGDIAIYVREASTSSDRIYDPEDAGWVAAPTMQSWRYCQIMITQA